MESRIYKTSDRVSLFAEKNLKNRREFGEDARLAFKRHLSDLRRSEKKLEKFPYVFIPEKAEDVIELANKLTITEGEEETAFICAGFQEFILGSLFGWVHRETGKRRFTDSYIQVARQQSKSVMNAILAIKCSNFDGYKYGQIYCTATKSDQARIVLDEISKFINADPELQELYIIKDYKNEITGKLTGTMIKALGRDTKSIDGFRPYLGIVDEYHAHKDNQMYKLLKGGTRHLRQSLISVITTAGFNLNGPCYELYQYCRRVLRKIDINERQFIYIAQMDEDDDIWDPKKWIKCCPLTGHDNELISAMLEDAKKAKSMGGTELLDFMTKGLDIWVKSAETAFINLADWEKCGCRKGLEDFSGKKAICGLDLSSGGDLTSLVLEFPYEDPISEDKRYYIYSHSFIPKNRMQEHMDQEDNAPYVIWEKEGFLTATTAAGGIKTDYKRIIAHLRMLIEEYNIDLWEIAYDPANASAFLSDLEDFGCELVEIRQSARSLNDATEDFRLAVKAHNVEYDESNKLLTRSMNDAILSAPNSFGEIKIDKMCQKNRIDPCDAVICAHKRAMCAEVEAVTIDQSVKAYLKMFGEDIGENSE